LTKRKTIPPKLPRKILKRFLRDDIAEEVTGDLEEKFHTTLKTKSYLTARLNYWYQVMQYFRPFAIKKLRPLHFNSSTMYKSYLKFAWRNLKKNKTYSLINISGLAVGLACCIAIGLYIADEYSYDRFHSRYKDIYRVINQQKMGDDYFTIASTAGPLGNALKSDFPEVEQYCRVGNTKSAGVLQNGESAIEPEKLLLVDNSFFNVFDFGLIQGNPKTALLSPDEVVITQSMATKLFGPEWKNSTGLIGSQIEYNDNRTLTLSGIAFDPPVNSHIQFDVLLSLRHEELNSEFYGWNSNNYHTYLLLDRHADTKGLNEKLYRHLEKYVSDESEITMSLQLLSDIYLHSDFDFQTDWSKTGNVLYVRVFSAVGLIVLLIAISNFVNLSTARATKRAKEVGVRKVVGAARRQLVSQFLTESFIITVISTSLALIFVQFFLPLLNDISGKFLHIPIFDFRFVLVIVMFVLLVSGVAGIYPALYLANLQSVRGIKGYFAGGGGHRFRHTVVVCQFTLSVVLLIGTIVIFQQLKFLQQKSLGFDKEQLLYVALKNDMPAKAGLIKADLLNQTSITSVSATSNNLINVVRSTGGIVWEGNGPGDKILMTHMNVDYDFLSTTGMTMITGRNINPTIASDSVSAYLINETAAKHMGWSPGEAVGKKLTMWENQGEIIGVVKDFHFRPMTEIIEPFLFRYRPEELPSGLFVKAKPNRVTDAISSIESIHKQYDHTSTPYYQFVDDALNNQYRLELNTGRIVMTFAVLTIFVACLGLFGLATYTAEQRTKEIGVRKVLGASITSIVSLISRDFIVLVGIAILIAGPVASWGMSAWLENFAYRIDPEWWMFGVSAIIALGIALFTISFQSVRAALINPAKTLRTE
jgi:ABC-type antimicrobial peptide transport system permease subunit